MVRMDKDYYLKIKKDYETLKKYNATLDEYKEYNANIFFEMHILNITDSIHSSLVWVVKMLLIEFSKNPTIIQALNNLNDIINTEFINQKFNKQSKPKKDKKILYKFI